MSGIYIPGMRMPTGDNNITLFLYPDGKVVMCGMLGPLGHYEAIPVPDHGRLVDKDVMCKECRRVAEEYDGIYPDCTYCPAHLAPTIVPADPADKEDGDG